MDEMRSRSDEIDDWVKELFPDSAAHQIDLSMWSPHEQCSALVKAEMPNNCQPSVDCHAYSRNLTKHQLMQNTSGCSSTPFMVKREQESLNVLQHADRTALQNIRDTKSGIVLERGHQRLQVPPSLHQSQNLTLAEQLKTGNQRQMMLHNNTLQASPETTSQVEMTNSIEWVNSAYHKILQIKEVYLPQFINLHNKLLELKRQATDVEAVNKWEKNRRFIEMTIRILHMSKQELLVMKKERVSQILNDAVRYISQPRVRNFHTEAPQIQQRENNLQFNNTQGSLQQPLRPGFLNSFNVGMHKVDPSSNVNTYQYNNLMRPTNQWGNVAPPRKVSSQISGLDSRDLRALLHPSGGVPQYNNLSAPQNTVPSSRNIFNSLDYSMAQTPISMPPLQNFQNIQQDPGMKRQKMKQPVVQKRNEDTKLRRLVGINQKWSPVVQPSSSSYAMSPQNSQQSSTQIDLKELCSKISKSATPSLSSASPSALPSPLTPMTPLTPSSMPVDSAKSPLPEESSRLGKITAAATKPSSLEKNCNQLSTDVQRSMKSCLHRESGDKQSSKAKGDPLQRLVEVVKSISSKALNATLMDIDAVTSLTDRLAGNIVRGKPEKLIFHDLADEIVCNFDKGLYLGMKREFDAMAFDDFTMDTEFYETGSLKRLKTEANNMLLKEIKEINKKLIEVVVDVMNLEEVSRPESGEGTLIRCSYIPVGFSGTIKIRNTSELMFPNLLVELIVASDYPNSSPTVLEKVPSGFCEAEEGKYMWMKAKSNFILSLRKLSEPISVKDMAEAWDFCAREVFHEAADQLGGGSFSSSYGKWENCAVAV